MFTGSPFGVISGLTFVGLLVYACAVDVRSRRIPNESVIMLALAGLVLSVAHFGVGPGALRASTGLAVGLALWLPFHVVRLLGAGDVKLFAAGSAWLGAGGALEAALIAALAGGLLAAVWMLRAHGVLASMRALGTAVAAPGTVLEADRESSEGRVQRLPYGIALATGLVVVAWWPGILFGM